MEKEFEDIVKEKLEEIYSEEQEDKKEQVDTDEKTEEVSEDFSAENFDDFLIKTDSKVTVKSEGKMPSPIFGNKDTNPHNKYRITIENPNGKISYIFWDSINNTQKNKPLNKSDALAAFGLDIFAYDEGPSYEEFVRNFGYDQADEKFARRAFDGCRKQVEKARKIFDDKQIEELKRLSSEY